MLMLLVRLSIRVLLYMYKFGQVSCASNASVSKQLICKNAMTNWRRCSAVEKTTAGCERPLVAKLSYAASAWWGFASADDKQRLNAFIRRSIRHGYCSPDINLADIIDTAHDNLFQQVLNDPNHVLAPLLPNRISSQYKDVYWIYCFSFYFLSFYVHDAFCHRVF